MNLGYNGNKLPMLSLSRKGRSDCQRRGVFAGKSHWMVAAGLLVLLVLDTRTRAQPLLLALCAGISLANFSLAQLVTASRGSRLEKALTLSEPLLDLVLVTLVVRYADLPLLADGILIALLVDIFAQRLGWLGAALAAVAGLRLFFLASTTHATPLPLSGTTSGYLWVAGLLGLYALHRAAVSFSSGARATNPAASQAYEAQQLETLVRISRELASQHEIEGLLETIALSIRVAFGFHFVSMVTCDDDGTGLYRRVLLGAPESSRRNHLGEAVSRETIEPCLAPQYEIVENCYLYRAEQPAGDPQVWHPNDKLLFVIPREDDQMAGYLSVDAPADGRVPATQMLRCMQIYVNLLGVVLAAMRSRRKEARRTQMLEDTRRKQNEFLSMVAHEIRAPLATIRGASSLLRDHHESLDRDRRDDFLAALIDGTAQLSRIVADLLVVSQIEAGRLSLRRQVLEPVKVVHDAVRAMLAKDSSRGISVIAQAGIPRVNADENRVFQVVTNLLSNAVKYSNERSVVIVALTCHDGQVRCAIYNDGEGIAESDRPRLFTLFGSLTRRATETTGLGLYITKQLVEAMGGEIGVESQPGISATFWFTLPAHDSSSLEHSAQPPVERRRQALSSTA